MMPLFSLPPAMARRRQLRVFFLISAAFCMPRPPPLGATHDAADMPMFAASAAISSLLISPPLPPRHGAAASAAARRAASCRRQLIDAAAAACPPLRVYQVSMLSPFFSFRRDFVSARLPPFAPLPFSLLRHFERRAPRFALMRCRFCATPLRADVLPPARDCFYASGEDAMRRDARFAFISGYAPALPPRAT